MRSSVGLQVLRVTTGVRLLSLRHMAAACACVCLAASGAYGARAPSHSLGHSRLSPSSSSCLAKGVHVHGASGVARRRRPPLRRCVASRATVRHSVEGVTYEVGE